MHADPQRYLWSTVCAWGLTISVVILGVCGAMAMFMPGSSLLGLSLSHWCVLAFAAMAALAVASANNAAAAAMHAISQPSGDWHWPTLLPSLMCAVGFAIASNVAVHLGWSVLTASASQPDALPSADDVNLAALFLCFAKPAMAWIIEGRRAMDASAKRAADQAEEERLMIAREAERSANRPRRQPFQPEVVEGGRPTNHVSQIGQPLAGVAAISAGVSGCVADRPAEAITFQPPTLEPVSHSQQTWLSREAHAAALLKQGRSQRAVVRETGLTRYKVSQIAADSVAA